MSRTRWMALAALLTAGVAAFAACGGGSGNNGSGSGTRTPAAQQTTSGGGASTAEAEPTKKSNSGGGGGSSSELQDLADKFAKSTFRASYEISGGDLEGITNGQIAIYKDGKDKLRFDIKGEQDGQAFEASFIETPTDSYLCLSGEAAASLGELIGVDTSQGVCTKSTPDDPTNPVGSLIGDFTDIAQGNVELQGKEKKTVAGEDGTCYTVLDKDTNETNVACFNDDGALLSIESGSSGTLTATSVEGSVSGSDFEPPYEVKDIPGLGQ